MPIALRGAGPIGHTITGLLSGTRDDQVTVLDHSASAWQGATAVRSESDQPADALER